ncbi:hypothetical protein ABVK25_008574 [Lepraria finkii]|uniref:Uncharacterized protein n=1 Tax=Lepraria finkii TaxID=1340010 RepID=A0ABR4B0A5_9LECA
MANKTTACGRILGNTVGAELEEERVFAINIKYWDQRRQFKATCVPRKRDILAIEDLTLGLVKYTNNCPKYVVLVTLVSLSLGSLHQ